MSIIGQGISSGGGSKYTGATTVTPGTSNQVLATNKKTLTSDITVYGDADLVASKIKYGVNIFGVAGSVRQFGETSFTQATQGTRYFSSQTLNYVYVNTTLIMKSCRSENTSDGNYNTYVNPGGGNVIVNYSGHESLWIGLDGYVNAGSRVYIPEYTSGTYTTRIWGYY